MITNAILFKDENMEVKEIYSSAGDYVLRLKSAADVEAQFGDELIQLQAGITRAFPSSAGKKLAKHFPGSVTNQNKPTEEEVSI